MKVVSQFWLLIACLWAGMANAGLLDSSEEPPFLPVDEAFRMQPGEIKGNTLSLRWDIAEEYYLYRHRFEFTVLKPKGISLGELQLPEGKHKFDEYFGDIQAYYNAVEARLPLILQDAAAATPDSVRVSVRYQGCADKGLCYPPQTREVLFEPALLASTDEASNTTETAKAQAANQPEQDRLASLIVDGHWLTIIGQFYLLGLLLAFTPCVLPMVPILSGVIVGLDKERSAGLAFLLSLAYVLAMAFAYALFGAIAGLFGHNLQAAMQAPAVLIGFSALFVALALSMFGVYKLQLPSALQSRLSEMSAKQKGGTLIGAAIMGFFSALIVGPCVAPPLAGALLYIGQTGDPLRGGMALFTLGLGMGTPLLLLGTLEGKVLPKTGAWMNRVNHFFGFILLGVAVWLLSRIAPAHSIMLMWGALSVGLGVYLGALSRAERSGWQQLEQTAGLLALVYGILILIGAALGGSDPLRPLAQQALSNPSAQVKHVSFQPIKSSEDLQLALTNAQRPVMLDFYADWCVACKDMEKHVFPAAEVRALLEQMQLLQADVTANDAVDKALMRELGVIGPPTMIFYHPDSGELTSLRLIGELSASDFAAHLRRVLSQTNNP